MDPNVKFPPVLLADEEGYFAECGLNVDVIPAGPNTLTGMELAAVGGADTYFTLFRRTLMELT